MVFAFDPRKLVDAEKKKKQDEAKEEIKKVSYDEEKAQLEKNLQKNKNVQEALSIADQAIREFKYQKEEGAEAYEKIKKEQDPDWTPGKWEDMQGILGGQVMDWTTGEAVESDAWYAWPKKKKVETLETEYGDKPEITPEKDKVLMSGTTGILKTEWKAGEKEADPFESEVGITESIGFALISGGIKIPYGLANVSAMIMDLAADENLSVDQSNVARLENWFDKTYFGNVMKYSESKARETAIGRITEALVQLYGGWKTVGKHGVKVTEKASKIFNRAYDAIKNGRYARTAGNSNLYKIAKETKKLNTLSGKQKFVGLVVGGGLSGGVVYDAEDIGTFGDWFFDEGKYTALDRKQRATAKEDALRMLYNKLKFGGEMGFPIIPSVVGLYKTGKLLLNQGHNLAYSNKAFEQYLEKFVAKPLRARGKFPEEEFQAMQRLEGKQASARKLAEDYLKNFDEIIKRISKNSQSAANASGLTDEISEAIVKVIGQGKLGVKNGRVVGQGFSPKSLNAFMKTLTEDLKIGTDDAVALVDELANVHGSWAEFLNTVHQGDNLNVGIKQFTDLMNDRIRNTLSSEYKIFSESSLKPIDQYPASKDVKASVAEIFRANAKANQVSMSKEEANLIVNDVIKNVKLDKTTGTPIFKYEAKGWDKEKAVITKNIAENITGGGKFKADKAGGLIQKESDLQAFKNLFGEYKNANRIIANVTADLANIAARDTFYNNIKSISAAMVKNGERGLVYPSYNQAVKAFWPKEVVSGATGLKLPQKIGEEAYTVPINNMFTSTEIAEGLKFGAANQLGSITKNIYYQYAVMLPKGLVQAGKTVLGPFTHTRNFASGAVTTIATGNIAINPLAIGQALRTAYRTVQPQLLGRNRPGISVNAERPGLLRAGANTADPSKLIPASEFTKEGGQSLYRFLLDEGMVNQSATYRDVLGLFEDIQKQRGIQWMYDKLNNKVKKFLKTAQELYIAEDDYWKVFNFFGESHRIRRSYANAIKAGKIKLKDVPGGSLESVDILKMATKNVREMLPNYAYVSDLVQASRRSPLGNFVSWPSEIIRTSTNMFLKGRSEAVDPIFARMGWERLGGMAIAFGTLAPLSVWAFKQMYGFTTEKLYALREFVPWFSKDSTILPVYVDGKYKYIDFSRGFFYDTMTQPIQALISGVEENKDKPLIPGLIEGMGGAIGRLAEPFISESIWLGGILDLFARKGVTRHGVRVFNERDDLGRQIQLSIQHLAKIYSPLSHVQIRRLYHAVTGETLKGQKYEIPDELFGLIGARPAPLDIKKTMNIFINEYLLKNERAERGLVFEDLRAGDPVSENQVLKQFIYGNRQKYESWSEMRRKIDAAKLLGYSDDELGEMFDLRGKGKDYDTLLENKFKPFGITKKTLETFDRLSEEKGIPNPMTETVLDKIDMIQELLEEKALNSTYDIDYNDWKVMPKGAIEIEYPADVLKKYNGDQSRLPTPPLPPTPQPKVAANVGQPSQIPGLTRSESALLSPSEKVIARTT